jgi:hypothetical protein
MSNVLQMKPTHQTQTTTPTAPAAEAEDTFEDFDYRNATVADLEDLWSFEKLNTQKDKYLVIAAKTIIYSLVHKEELKGFGLTKAHILQATIQVLVESTKEMNDALTTGDQETDPYLQQVSKVAQ